MAFSFLGLIVVVFVVGIVITLLVVLAKNSYTPPPPPPADLNDAQIYDLARSGNKIQAIKWYRQLHGVGLKEAKDAVERIVP